MSTMRMGRGLSVQASAHPAPSRQIAPKRASRKNRHWLLKHWVRWRAGGDAWGTAYRLLRLDDTTLSALGLRREAIRSDLLRLDDKGKSRSAGGETGDAQR